MPIVGLDQVCKAADGRDLDQGAVARLGSKANGLSTRDIVCRYDRAHQSLHHAFAYLWSRQDRLAMLLAP